MKRLLLNTLLLFLGLPLMGQVYPDDIVGADSLHSILVGTKQAIQQTLEGPDTTYTYEAWELEFRYDSLCISGGDCFLKLPRIVKQATVSFISDEWYLTLSDSLGNQIVQTLMYGLIDEIQTLSDGDGATTYILQTGGILNELKYRDGNGVDIYVDTGEEIKFRVDTAVVATQYDLTQITDTQLTDEEVQDIAGGMVTGNAETLIDVTYQDGDGTIDFVVENDLSLYDNSTSGFFNTQAAANYWTLSSGNLSYSDGNVLVGTSSINRDVVINGRINIQNSSSNVFIGEDAGNTTATGIINFGIGRNSLESLTTGLLNVGLGSNTLNSMLTGSFNLAIGSESLETNSIGSYNVSFGHKSQELNTGSKNISVGAFAMSASTGADDNVVVGYQAGRDITGDKNVMIGYEVGKTFTGSNTLYIDNQDTGAPLIHGDFSTNILEINGDLDVTGDFESNGKVTVGDNIEGNAVNIAGYDSQNDLTRVSIGDNLTLTSGTLAADDQTPVQSLGSAYMNTIDYDSGDYPTQKNIAISTEIHDNGDVTVETGFEHIAIDSDGGGYYNVFVSGRAACMSTGGTENAIEFYSNVSSTYTLIGTVDVEDLQTESFTLQSSQLFGNNSNVILSIKSPTSAAAGVEFTGLKFELIKI